MLKEPYRLILSRTFSLLFPYPSCLFVCLLACSLFTYPLFPSLHRFFHRRKIPVPPIPRGFPSPNPALRRFPFSPFLPSRSSFSPLRVSNGSSWAISRAIECSKSSRIPNPSFRFPTESRVPCEFDRFRRVAPSSSSPSPTRSPPTTRAACTGSSRSRRATRAVCSRSASRNRFSTSCEPNGRWGTSCGPCSATWRGARGSW